jgi:hypothetical protein
MKLQGIKAVTGAAALFAVALAVAPAISASEYNLTSRAETAALRGEIGHFTPSAADPKLAAIYARGGLANRGFRFTSAATGKSHDVTVAVRAPSGSANLVVNRVAPPVMVPQTGVGIEPVSYSLGTSVGWSRFAVPGTESAKIEAKSLAPLPERTSTGPGLPNRKWNTRVQIAAERPVGQTRGTLTGSENLSVDVGGSFRLTRNLDVTAGVRIRSDRDRLQQAADQRRDSQAVYVGTAFKF